MRSSPLRSFLLILGLTLLVGAPSGLARAQEATPNGQNAGPCDYQPPGVTSLNDVSAEGVFVNPLGPTESRGVASQVQVFQAFFALQYAAIPKCDNPAATVAYVQSGEFALDTGGKGLVIVDPPEGTPIRTMELLNPAMGFYQDTPGPTYLQNADGSNCTDQCVVPANGIVHVVPGSTVYSPHESRCLWCLMTSLPGALTVTAVMSNQQTMAKEPFAWTQFDFSSNALVIDEIYGKPAAGTPTAPQWWFNPPTNCGRGGG
ncbi:MAG TPA: hypothetical protein VFU81_15060 [Thermomicrobiales bacterium]|nr:hypothetical protein [Thermomicrobiales bacterium]